MSVQKNKADSGLDNLGIREGVLVINSALIVGTWWWFTRADSQLEARIKKLEENDKVNKKRVATLTAQIVPLKSVLPTVRDHAEKLEELGSNKDIKSMQKRLNHVENFLSKLDVEVPSLPPKTGHLTSQQIEKRKREIRQVPVKTTYQESFSQESLDDSSKESISSNQSLEDEDEDPFAMYDAETKAIDNKGKKPNKKR
jgi:hypothetical protein